MLNRNNLRDSILADLVTFSSYQCPLNSTYFQSKYDGLSKRELTLIITDLIETDSKHLICSKDDGYYVAKSVEEANHGIAFIASREQKLRERRQRLEQLSKQMFGEPVPSLFDNPIDNPN